MLKPDPITAYVGVNGSGKSVSAIAFAVRDFERNNRFIITNMQGLSVPHAVFEDVEDIPNMLAEYGSSNIIIDEAGAMFSSRDTGRNKAFGKVVQQLRKYDTRLLWTAPAYARADKILREVTFKIILCQPVFKGQNRLKAWPTTRLVLQKSFDASRIDSSGMSVNRNARATGLSLMSVSKYWNCFDSFAVANNDAER